MPGDVSQVYHGVLLLDEWPECRRHVLQVLRHRSRTVLYLYNLALASVLDFAGLTVLVEHVHEGTG